VKRIKVEDGINAVRQLFPQVYFDASRCETGVDCLENYRKKYDAKTGEYLKSPVHDKFSHGADAFRYLATHYTPDLGYVNDRAIGNVSTKERLPIRGGAGFKVIRSKTVWEA
jgi:hypothetical protein